MKQKFRNDLNTGNMKCKYYIDKPNNIFDHWLTTAEVLTDQIVDIVNYYKKINIRLTNRQLYYQLVGKDLIPNAMEIYKRICVFLTDLRYNGIVDWDILEDKARKPEMHSEWNDINGLIKTAVKSFRLPRWKNQDFYIEMYCEKEAGINVLQPIAEKYHIHFGFNKGYASAAALYELSNRIKYQINNEKEVIILYFGDHDPSGLDMIRDINDRVYEFLTEGEDYISPDFIIDPVSLSIDQVKQYNLPPNPAKITDPRSKWYTENFGKISWELDAIDAMELRKIAENSILKYIDIYKYNNWIKREKREINILTKFGDSLKLD